MPLKILLLSHKFHPDLGGIETISWILAHAFAKAGHDVHVLTWSANASECPFPFVVVRQPKLLTLLKEHLWADLVFENNPCMRLSFPNLLFRKRRIVGLQTWISRTDGRVAIQDKLKRFWLKSADKVVACSQAVRIGCWPSAAVIGNPYQETFKQIAGVARDKEFIFLGRLVSDKGAAVAIHAFYQLIRQKYAEVELSSKPTLTIVGEGPELESLTQLVTDYDLHRQVIFLGARSGPALVELLNKHKYILVPSLWEEPFGIVVLEGMACGCIPVVADSGGLPEAVGSAGIIFQKGSIKNLVTSMQQLIEDPILCESLKTAALIHLKNHEASVVSARYLAVIRDLSLLKCQI